MIAEPRRQFADAMRRMQQHIRAAFKEGLVEAFPKYYELPDASRAALLRGTGGLMLDLLGEDPKLARALPADGFHELGRRLGTFLSHGFELVDGAPLGPVESALMVDSLLRPLSIAAHAKKIASLYPEEETHA